MLETLASIERAIASALSYSASFLQLSADSLSSSPISNTCSQVTKSLFSSSLNDLSGVQLFLISFVSAFSFVLIITVFFHFLNAIPTLLIVPTPAARYDPDIDPQSDLFVDEDVKPQLTAPSTDNSIVCINPSTAQTLGHVKMTDPKDLKKIIDRSKKAQVEWGDSNFRRRRKVLKALQKYILFEQKSICDISCRDTGKTTLEASLGEILPSLEKLRWLLTKEAEKSIQPSYRSTGPISIHKVARVDYLPVGIILAIAPWNYPFHNLMNPISAALFTGNSIIIKPSEHTAISSIHYIRIMRRILTLCGESPDLVQCVIGGPEIGQALTESDEIDKIFFTGSTNIGKKVAASAVSNLTPTCLELGGKDPFIICDDAEIKHALSFCMRGVYQNAGQNCVGVERVYVHSKIKAQFVEMAENEVGRIRAGIDMGAMTLGEVALNNIQQLVDDAVSKGASIVIGGKRIPGENGYGNKGYFYAPTIVDNVTMDMRIAREEVFGPVMSIFEWENDEDLIKMVNDCSFGLGSTIFTQNQQRGEQILKRLNVGMGNINDFAANYLCQSMPFGGMKNSGSDRFAGIEGLRGCCTMKASTRDRFLWIKTRIPKALQYPSQSNATEFAMEINDLVYNPKLMSKIDNVRNLLGMLLFRSWRPRATGSG